MRPRKHFRGPRLSMGQPGGPRHICLYNNDQDFLADGQTKRGIPRGPRGPKNDISMVGQLYKYKFILIKGILLLKADKTKSGYIFT